MGIYEYLCNKISLLSFINYLKMESIDEKKAMEVLTNQPEDERTYIVYLLLFFLKDITFDDYDIPFVHFLKSIELETENNFKAEVLWHFQNEEAVIFQIDHIYFIINNYNKRYKIELPISLQNGYHLCINCNDELYFNNELILEPVEFYLISNE